MEPDTFRRFAPESTAKMDEVWRAVASGDTAMSHRLSDDLEQSLGGTLSLGERGEVSLRVGALATTVPPIDAVVNERRGEQLGMVGHNALVVSAEDNTALAGVLEDIRTAIGKRGEVHPLRRVAPTGGGGQAAHLTDGALARAVGSFRYRYFSDGTVEPDRRWVAANIRTETVPILGRVTCHRVMLAQLRAALTEIVERDLAHTIDAGDYGGCYVPRFIGHDRSRGLSLHTWGIAIDLNVAGNQRGTAGEIDRRVVAVFKRWGFAWGGDWSWSDPMHFELAALVKGAS